MNVSLNSIKKYIGTFVTKPKPVKPAKEPKPRKANQKDKSKLLELIKNTKLDLIPKIIDDADFVSEDE